MDVYRVDEFHATSQPGDWSEDTLQPITEVEVAGPAVAGSSSAAGGIGTRTDRGRLRAPQ